MSAALLEAWRASPRDEHTAQELLAPFRHTGVVVASDTAGLSRMALRFPLPVVLHRLHGPKARLHERIHGGRPIGVWFADNTTTLYDAPVDAPALLRSMAAVHDDGPVRIGIALHHGDFWLVDDGLYGPDAERVLELAELHCRGGETRITPSFRALLEETDGLLVHPPQPSPLGPTQNVELITPGLAPAPTGDTAYPRPYGPQVHAQVLQMGAEDPHALVQAFDERWKHQRTVLVVYLPAAPPNSARETLEALDAHARLHALAHELLPEDCKIWRDLAIAAFADPEEAVRVARDLRTRCHQDALAPVIGLDRGEVYLFPMEQGCEFAGAPVNRASKLAEDLGSLGQLLVSEAAARDLVLDGTPEHWSVSGIEIRGLVL